MSYLVYCILNGGRGPARPSVVGVRRQTVWVLECGGLCAAVSETGADTDGEIADAEFTNDVSALRLEHLVPYATAVEAFNRGETVVPMRYGCRFKSVAEVRTWLQERAGHFHALLARLDGCVEMGVRMLLVDAPGLRDDGAGSMPATVAASSRRRGLPGGATQPFRDYRAGRTHRADRARRAIQPLPRVAGRDPRGGRHCDGVAVLPGRARSAGRLSRGLWPDRRRPTRP